MIVESILASICALLHDIGKVVQRAGGVSGTHSKIGIEYLRGLGFTDKDVIDSVQFHHSNELRMANDVSKFAYITYIADNIAAATDRRSAQDDYSEQGWDAKMPLQSVFNLIHYESERHYYKPVTLDSQAGINTPETDVQQFDEFFYRRILERISENIKDFDLTEDYINSLLELAEATLSYVPSSTNKAEVADVSLYDHMKLTAAIAVCIYQYMHENEEINYKELLYDNSTDFYDKNFAIVYSADISGIQDFIYTIHSDGALKTLRGRSFYLELFIENLIDDILDKLELTRANLLYSGGGHFYMLLPNTEKVKSELSMIISNTNIWLLNYFRAALYVADGYFECSANRLQNKPQGAYGEIFQEISRIIASKKIHRYNTHEINMLNNQHMEGRECRICKAVRLYEGDECNFCGALIVLSRSVVKHYDDRYQEDDIFYVVTKESGEGSIPISESQFIAPISKSDLEKKLITNDDIVRYYSKNTFYMGKNLSTKLWIGDYCMEKEISEYAVQAAGVDRIAVLRMDIDNLGKAFISGFAYDDGKYNTISRTSTFSRHLSMFFKRDLNTLLSQNMYRITIIYSGGDDMFLIGGWDDIIAAAVEISEAFRIYTQDKLSVSAGIGLYPSKFPIHIMARETGELESHSKARRENGEEKNAITLFDKELRFSWLEFINQVRDEKLAQIESFFKQNSEKGNSFLYRILSFIKGLEEEDKKGIAKISLARYAYMLARVEPDESDENGKARYKVFSELMYKWISDSKDRKQLKAAIYLYVYANRGNEQWT
ncbi:MAG: type III-A CRISPR-associated protein Cas10/Csm1 [Oscillospiraceae bacterium]|nr:type III-A CRISPR-associated protein Cas10/Csm1 [Oscillospiraceae bacterium]